MEHPEIQGLPHHAPGERVWTKSGLTETYAQTVVLTSVEDAYFDRPVDAFLRRSMEGEYGPPSPLPNANRRVIEWKHGSVSYPIAVNEDSGELERYKGLHMKLREDIRGIPALQAVVEAFKELHRLEEALKLELRRIQDRAVFPGGCGLCSG
jgi:hypothetical protein